MNRVIVIPVLSALAFLLTAADAPPQPKTATPTPITVPPNSPPPQRRPGRVKHQVQDRLPHAVEQVAKANRSATIAPDTRTFSNAVQIYPFSDGLLYQIYTAPGRVTDIALQPGEILGAVASGDTVRWVIGDTTSGTGADKRTHVLVKPFAAGLSTNLVITTDRRSYHLALVSTAGAAMAALSWSYPQDVLIALKNAQSQTEAAAPVATGIDFDRLQFNYAISGDHPSWRPLRAFDDGRQTFIEFPATLGVGEAPPLFLVAAEGDAQLVNYRVRGRFYIVDRLFDAAELRLGTKHQDVVRISRVSEGSKRQRRAS